MERGEESDARTVAVCVCTFKRPVQLARLLDSLNRMLRPSTTIFVVVDNDGQDPQVRQLVDSFRDVCGARVEYVIERIPGISAARNTAFATARSLGARTIASLDDDEQASPNWLMRLLESQEATGAAVVGGPVRPVFLENGAILNRYAGLWSLGKGLLNGRVYVCCTCNCLIDLSAAAILGEQPFSLEFGLTGGEDSVFFRQLFFAGVAMAWAEEAVVYDEITGPRASKSWMRRRWYRYGNAGVKSERAAPDPRDSSPLVKTMLLSVRLCIYPLLNHQAIGSPFFWLLESDRIRGRWASHFGIGFAQYDRTEAAIPKVCR